MVNGKFRPLTWLLVGFVRVWRAVISPLYGNVCKYYPSCSAYGLEALKVHGAFRGSAYTVWRILRCNPWSNGGYDPVPGTQEALAWAEEQRLPKTCPAPHGVGTDHQTRGEQ